MIEAGCMDRPVVGMLAGPALAAPEPALPRAPIRLQRSRRKGARIPIGAVYVSRPTIFANPFCHRRFGHARSVKLHALWVDCRLGDLTLEKLDFCPREIEALHRFRNRMLDGLHRLVGRDLVCWCPTTSRWCHADKLLRLANEGLLG